MTLFSKLGFCPPIDQPRAFAEAYAKRTHGAATPRDAYIPGIVRPDRVGVLPPPHDEHLWPRAACQTLPEPLENIFARQLLGNENREAFPSELIHEESASE